jgi:hypothetical protein
VFTPPAAVQNLSGRAAIADGDTQGTCGEQARIRGYGIDAPEGKQTCGDTTVRPSLCGSRSADALAGIIGRNGVTRAEYHRWRFHAESLIEQAISILDTLDADGNRPLRLLPAGKARSHGVPVLTAT